MQAAEAPDGFGEGGFDLRMLPDIAFDELGVAAGILAARTRGIRRRRTTRRINLRDNDLCAFFGKALSSGAANATATARYECNFSCETRP